MLVGFDRNYNDCRETNWWLVMSSIIKSTFLTEAVFSLWMKWLWCFFLIITAFHKTTKDINNGEIILSRILKQNAEEDRETIGCIFFVMGCKKTCSDENEQSSTFSWTHLFKTQILLNVLYVLFLWLILCFQNMEELNVTKCQFWKLTKWG